jgi:putative ATPase
MTDVTRDREPMDEGEMTLFASPAAPGDAAREGIPLAARMRPRTLDEFVGQQHLIGPGAPLRRAIEEDRVTSCIFWGQAGTGKSTLAFLIGQRSKAHFASFSAVTSGVADVRRAIAEAKQRMSARRQKTVLFIDEIHRFNKAQQDAFLPHVEDGTIVLIGATTENPFFSINPPLMSRCRLYVLERLTDEHLTLLIQRALADPERGLAGMKVTLEPDALAHLVNMSEGDARVVLGGLEASAHLAQPDADGARVVTIEIAVEALQRRLLDYDREEHFDVISAFIKSMRGSDPDAALYWLARMLEAGEDARFIARRLVIHAAEDVGNADPMALVVATSAAHAVEFVGLPEAQIPLAEATIYIATAPKSNKVVEALGRAREDVKQRAAPPVPVHLRSDSYPGAERLGHGKGYLYPHSFPGGVVAQEYLPAGAQSRPYYEPTEYGHEAAIKRRMEEWRKAKGGAGGGDAKPG